MTAHLPIQAFSVAKAAELLDCSKSHIHTLIKNGDLRCFTIGKRGRRIPSAELERFQRERLSTAKAIGPLDDAARTGLPSSAVMALLKGGVGRA